MPTASTSYTLACSGPGGNDSHNALVSVSQQPPAVTISVTPTTPIKLGESAMLNWSATPGLASCIASGTDSTQWSGPKDPNGFQPVTPAAAGTNIYTLTCTDGTKPYSDSKSLKVNSTIPNVVTIAVDGGPPAAGHTVNLPYISVTLCLPGPAPQTCKTIDHVDVDTASFGVRIVASALLAAPALNLAQQFDTAGDPVAECVQFLSGYTWGSVRLADVKLAGEVAHNMPIQIIGDLPDASVPSACTSSGPALKTVQDVGSNGIIGVGPFIQDCPGCATQALAPHYYGCPFNGTCAPIKQALANQVQNPVANFKTDTGIAVDNNGVIVDLSLSPVGANGAKNVAGSLILGIGTHDNNALSGGMVPLNANGNFTSCDTSTNISYANSFIDSGSNGFFLPANLRAPPIPACQGTHTDFYCPASHVDVPVLNRKSTDQFCTGLPANISIDNAQSLFATGNDAYSNLAGPLPAIPNLGLDFGLPFFFGKRVSTAIEGVTTPGVTPGPFVAY